MNLIKYFTLNEPEFLRPIQDHPLLEEGKRKEMLHYLNGFFRQLDKTKGLLAELK
jgi:hypothetical protein